MGIGGSLMPYSETFQQMLVRLRDRTREARQFGMNTNEITQMISQVGDWLAREAEPRSYEQRLLKDFWDVCDEQEKAVITEALIRVAEEQVPNIESGTSSDALH